jgi:hypothetical protein
MLSYVSPLITQVHNVLWLLVDLNSPNPDPRSSHHHHQALAAHCVILLVPMSLKQRDWALPSELCRVLQLSSSYTDLSTYFRQANLPILKAS